MAQILITGSKSFVGNNYNIYSKNNRINEISLLDNKVSDIEFRDFDTVLHVAAIVHQSKKIPESEYYAVNRDLTLEVAKKAKMSGVKQFVFMSTVKVYGEFNPDLGSWTEMSACYPDDPYGRSKYEAELALKKLADEHFVVSIIRTPLVYGVGVRANMYSIMKLVDKFKVLPFGKVNNKRSFTYVKNLVGFIDRIIEKRAPGTFIAMDSDPVSTTELVKLIARYLHKKRILLSIPGFIVNIGKKLIPRIFERLYGSFEMENSLTLKKLVYHPEFNTEEGIKDMVDAYLKKKNEKL